MRAVVWVGSVVVALAIVVGAGRLWAESKEKKTAATRTRIALLNLKFVIQNYDKCKQFRDEIKEIAEKFQKRDAELRVQLNELRDKDENLSILPAADESTGEKPRERELHERATRTQRQRIQRQLEDNRAKAKKEIGKKSDHQMMVLYLDVAEAAQHYAAVHDLDLVLQHNDATNKEDYFSPQNIARKMKEGALMPVYWKQDMDISLELVSILNRNMRKK